MHINYTLPLEFWCDSSGIAMSTVVMQRYPDGARTIEYNSKTLSEAERRLHSTTLELLAVVWAVQTHAYLLHDGKPFTVYSDAKILNWAINTKHADARLLNYALILQNYIGQMTICHRPGTAMKVPDALSRIEIDKDETEEISATINVITQSIIPPPTNTTASDKDTMDPIHTQAKPEIDLNEAARTMELIGRRPATMRQQQRLDVYLGPIIRYLLHRKGKSYSEMAMGNIGTKEKVDESHVEKVAHEFILGPDELLYYSPTAKTFRRQQQFINHTTRLRLCIPYVLVRIVVHILHADMTTGGHRGVQATTYKARERYYFSRMSTII
jgi:hypothetical protein